MPASPVYLDTLKGVNADLSDLLDAADEWHRDTEAGLVVGDEFRQKQVRFAIQNKDGSRSHYLIATRWLSASCLHFIHGGFMHPGCKCTVSLPLSRLQSMDVAGAVSGCRHVYGRLHEIEMRFKDEMHGNVLRMLARSRVTKPMSETEIRSLGGTMLCVDSNRAVDTIEDLVSDTQITITRTETAADAINRLKATPFDAVTFELDLPDLDGEQFARRAQRRCRTASFIAVTSVVDRSRLQSAIQNGVRDIVMKPLKKERLLNTLGKFLPTVDQSESTQNDEPLPTADDLDIALSRLKTAFNRRDFDRVVEWSTALRNLGIRLSNTSLVSLSENVIEELERSRSIAGSTPVLERLFFEVGEVIESLKSRSLEADAA